MTPAPTPGMRKFPEIKYSGKLPLMEISMIGKTEQQDPINHEYLASKYKNELEGVLLATAEEIARQDDLIRDLQQKADAYELLRRVVGMATGHANLATPDSNYLAVSLKRRYQELQAVPVDRPEPTPEEGQYLG